MKKLLLLLILFAPPSFAAIVVEGSNWAEDGSATTPTAVVTAPSGIQDDDLLWFLACASDGAAGGGPTVTLPSGSTEVFQFGTASGFDRTIAGGWKVAASESGNYTFTSTRDVLIGQVYRISGVDTSTPMDVTYAVGSHKAENSNSSTPNAPDITTTTDGAYVMTFVCATTNNTITGFTEPTGYTEVESTIDEGSYGGLNNSLETSAKTVATAGAQSIDGWDSSGVNSSWTTITVALRPTAPDTTAPTCSVAPTQDDITATSVTTDATCSDETDAVVDHYWGVTANDATDPTAAELRTDTYGGTFIDYDASDSGVANAAESQVVLTGLSASTAYDVFHTVCDSADNCKTVVQVDVTTEATGSTIVFDAISTDGTTPYSVSHTITGADNRMMILVAQEDNSHSASGDGNPTYDGFTSTKLGCAAEGITETCLYYIKDVNLPASGGAYDCDGGSGSTGFTYLLHCLTYSGVDQTAALTAVFDNDTSEPLVSTAIGTVEDGAWLVMSNMENSSTTYDAVGGQTERYDTFIAGGTAYVTDKVFSSADGAGTVTANTAGGGSRMAMGTVLIRPAESSSACAVDDASPQPGDTIAITGCPAFAGNITTLTGAEGDTITAEVGADTTSADFIIPAESAFAASASMDDTEWSELKTWTVGDGSTTENITLRIDPPATDFFGTMTCTESSNCPGDSIFDEEASGSVTGDDYYLEELTGTLNLLANGILSGAGTAEFRWYDESTTVWSAIATDIVATADGTAPVISSLVVDTNYGTPPDDDNLDVSFTTANDANGNALWMAHASSGHTCDQIEVGSGADAFGSVAVLAEGGVAFATSDISDGTWYIEVCHEDATGNDSNVLASSAIVIDATPPTITSIDVTNVALDTYDIDATFDDTATAYRWCTTNPDEETLEIIDNGSMFTPGIGDNDFNSQIGNGLLYCHFYQVDAYLNEAQEDSVAFFVSSLKASISEALMELSWGVALDVGAGGNGGFALTCDGGAVTPTYSAGDGSSVYTYTLSRSVLPTEVCTLAYTQPGNGLEEAANNDLTSFSGEPVSIGGSFCRDVLTVVNKDPTRPPIRLSICQ